MKRISLLLILLLTVRFYAVADEGMWLPIFLKQLNEQDMKSRGMKVSAEDIYSINHSSMKDAVVLFGGGCTGEIISDQGLLLTNHHCGFSQIQSHSSLEHDYLKNGFWAYRQDQELQCPGLTVTFIIRIDDVTSDVLGGLSPNMNEKERDAKIKSLSAALEKKAVEGTHYTATVKPFFNGNQYYLMLQETFRDIRMVGAPPSSIGKFGGDTDNWMWPRHTGDFSLFRIYAGKDNKPADYSNDNVPFKPRHSFPVSIKGVQPGDFTMVYGFPGRTTQYISSYAVKNIIEVYDPALIAIRTARLKVIDASMRSGDKLRIQYAAKQASIANAWKKWQGELQGLQRMNTLETKRAEEVRFSQLISADSLSGKYADILPEMERLYSDIAPLSKSVNYINEAAFGVELLKYAVGFQNLIHSFESNPSDEAAVKKELGSLLSGVGGFYKDLDVATDMKLFASMMQMYSDHVQSDHQPSLLIKIKSNYMGDWVKAATALYTKSIFSDSTQISMVLSGKTDKVVKKITGDPLYQLAIAFKSIYTEKLEARVTEINGKLTTLNRRYMAAQMHLYPEKKFYPDANSTLRVAFGQVGGYEAKDAMMYDYTTSLKGVMEKEDPSIEEFEVSPKLKELFVKKDFGDYGSNGVMPLAFIASNHTTGGNSGSPVLNANGELIGTNFDRVWEGTMSDIDFDPDHCRNISLDVRYTLFVIDKFAGCSRLIDEMRIVK